MTIWYLNSQEFNNSNDAYSYYKSYPRKKKKMWTDRIEDLVRKYPMPWSVKWVQVSDSGVEEPFLYDAENNYIDPEDIANAFTPAGNEEC